MNNMIESGKYVESMVGVISTTISFKKRGIVILNRKNNKVWTIEAKARNTDMKSVVKYLAKAYLADERRTYLGNSNIESTESNFKERNYVSAAMGGDVLMITDKDGNIRKDSVIYAEENLRNSFGIRKSHTIYDLVVIQGRGWDDEKVVYHLSMWVEAAMKHMSARERSNQAIEAAANNTEKVETSIETPISPEEELKAKRKAAAMKAAETRRRNQMKKQAA